MTRPQRRINLVDAIAYVVPTLAKVRTVVTRMGIVTALPSPYVTVNVSGVAVDCNILADVTCVVGDQVLILVDGDLWVVVGRILAAEVEASQHGNADRDPE